MIISIEDNGCGMTKEQTEQVTDPFFTTRTTRSVGLGVPFFKYSAECTGGSFEITSTPGRGRRCVPGIFFRVSTGCRWAIWQGRCIH